MAVTLTSSTIFYIAISLLIPVIIAQSGDFRYYKCPKYEPWSNFSLHMITNQKLIYNVALINASSTPEIVYNCSYLEFFRCNDVEDTSEEYLSNEVRLTAVVSHGTSSFAHRFIFPDGSYVARGGFVKHPDPDKAETYLAETTWLEVNENYQIFVICNPRTKLGGPNVKVIIAHPEGELLLEETKAEILEYLYFIGFASHKLYFLEHSRCKYNARIPLPCQSLHCWSDNVRTRRCRKQR